MLTKPSLQQPTPRPWNIVPDLSHMGSLTTIEAEPVPFSNKWPRMIVQVGGTASVFELEASARLIAHAHDLLAALECLEKQARAVGNSPYATGSQRAMLSGGMAKAREAIARATGAA